MIYLIVILLILILIFVRCIRIVSDEVETWDGIMVGMSKNRLTATYEEIFDQGPRMILAYQGDEILKPDASLSDKNYFSYIYTLVDNRIAMIEIFDREYAEKMK